MRATKPHASFVHPGVRAGGDDTVLAPGEVYHNFVRMDVLHGGASL